MSKKSLILPMLLSILLLNCLVSKAQVARYQIFSSDGMSFLLDTVNGSTWRNIKCDKEQGVLNCWQLMEHKDIVPIDMKNILEKTKTKK